MISFLVFGLVMGHEVGLYLGLDDIENSSKMMIFIIISYLFNCTFWIYPLGFSVGAYKWHLVVDEHPVMFLSTF